jgi:hypothetical protein
MGRKMTIRDWCDENGYQLPELDDKGRLFDEIESVQEQSDHVRLYTQPGFFVRVDIAKES